MEYNSFNNLVELLKSQVILYSEIRDVLQEEQKAIREWNVKFMFELNKKKDQLSKREKLLEEARKTLSLRIREEHSLNSDSLQDIIDCCDDQVMQDSLISLRDNLLIIVSEISQVSTTLKMLYSTNLKIIDDVKVRMGYFPSNKYGMDKNISSIPSSLHIVG